MVELALGRSAAGCAGWASLVCALAACTDSGDALESADDAGRREPDADALGPPAFCSRDGADEVRDLFCAEPTPVIGGLDELQVALALKPDAQLVSLPADEGDRGQTLASVAVLGHSTALGGRFVSPINPRVIVMGPDTLLAFARGTQRVELMSRGRDHGQFNFYVIDFEQPCNQAEGGCSPGDLYTPRIESDWRKVVIRDGVELENTALDCRVCHQRASETPTLLMRELEAPWTHFFYPRSSVSSPGVSGSDLMNDYLEAKGDELYAAMPPPESRQLDPTARDRLIEYLRGDPSSLDPDGVLDRAARLDMTGGGGQDRRVASAL